MASWFYLTLWHGTPPEFTHNADVIIETETHTAAGIHALDALATSVNTKDDYTAQIEATTIINTDVITKTEVIWLVGGA